MIEKSAKARQRARRKDQFQEEIVSAKDAINERTTKLIELLKELKRGWNGGPAPGVGISKKVNLTEPMPDELINAGQVAVRELSDIINNLQAIDAKQDNYSAERVKKLTERAQQMQALQQQEQQPQPQQFQAAASLEKQASNKLTRLWSYIVAPFSSEKGKRQRIHMLKSLARLDSELKELQNIVLSSGKSMSSLEAVHSANKILLDVKNTFFDVYRENLDQMTEEALQELSSLEKELVKLDKESKEQKNLEDDKVTFESKPKANIDPGEKPSGKLPETATPQSEQVYHTEQPPQTPAQSKESEDIIKLKKEVERLSGALQSSVSLLPDKQEKEKQTSQKIKDETKPETEGVIQTSEDIRISNIVEEIKNRYIEIVNTVNEELEEVSHPSSGLVEPWGSFIISKRQDFQKAQQVLNSSHENFSSFLSAYESFVRKAGDVVSAIENFEIERSLAEHDPFFEIGDMIKSQPQKLQEESESFAKTYLEEIKKLQQMEVQASNRFGRGFKRIMTQLSFAKDKHIRLQIDKDITQARRGLSEMMDNLEKKNIDFSSLFSDSYLFYNSIIDICNKLADLGNFYNSLMSVDKSKKKMQKERFKYDMIPARDINMLKQMAKEFNSDLQKINKLKETENKLPKIRSKVEQLRRENET